MNKLLSTILLATMLISHSVYAETVKSSKKIKSTDTNQTMSDDEFMKKMMAFEQRQNDAKAKTAKSQADLDSSKKLGQTLDEINKLLGVDK